MLLGSISLYTTITSIYTATQLLSSLVELKNYNMLHALGVRARKKHLCVVHLGVILLISDYLYCVYVIIYNINIHAKVLIHVTPSGTFICCALLYCLFQVCVVLLQ